MATARSPDARQAAEPVRRLLIVTHAEHKIVDSRLVSYAPEVLELDRLGSLFDEVVILAPLVEPSEQLMYPEAVYEMPTVRLIPTPFRNCGRLRHIVHKIPQLLTRFERAAVAVSAVHIRCPSNLALVCMVILWLRRRPTFIKYRGAWNVPRQPVVYKLQKLLITRVFRGSFVGAYLFGDSLPAGLVPMFASTLSAEDMRVAADAATGRLPGGTKLLSAGALRPWKNLDVLIRTVALLPSEFTLCIAGDGEQRGALEDLARKLGVMERVRFAGQLGLRELYSEMRDADLFLNASASEGYGKVFVEAMAHGLPCVASRVDNSRHLVARRGLTFALNDSSGCRDAILRLTHDAMLYATCSQNARAFAEHHTLERLGDIYREQLAIHGILSA